jgi:hypothetical protein
MSIRINLENKTFKEPHVNHAYEEYSEGDGGVSEKINTPRQSTLKVNDLSKKKSYCNSSGRWSNLNPSTTDKLSNYSLDSNISNKISSLYEPEKEFIIDECPESKIRTPVKNDSQDTKHEHDTNPQQERNKFSKKIIIEKNNPFDKAINPKLKLNYPDLNSVVKNLNEDFNKLQHECSTSRDSKQYKYIFLYFSNLSDLSNILAEKNYNHQFDIYKSMIFLIFL